MSLGTGAYKVGGAGQCSSTRKEVSMTTLRAMPTRHRHTELFSGILTDQILNWPETKMGGRAGKKNTAQKWQPRQGSSKIHFAKNCRQATANTSHEVPSLKASGHPSIAEKTAGQHCIKANFAQITFSHINYFIQQCKQVGPPLTTLPSSAPTSKKLVVSNGKWSATSKAWHFKYFAIRSDFWHYQWQTTVQVMQCNTYRRWNKVCVSSYNCIKVCENKSAYYLTETCPR